MNIKSCVLLAVSSFFLFPSLSSAQEAVETADVPEATDAPEAADVPEAADAPEAADVPAASRSSVYVRVNVHHESRDPDSSVQPDFAIGYDFRLSELSPSVGLYLGGRAGVYREEVLSALLATSATTKPFFGAQFYALIDAGAVGIRLGIAGDLLKGDDDDPVYAYVGFEPGIRFQIGERFYADFIAAAGVFPAFDPTAYMLKAGAEFGVRF